MWTGLPGAEPVAPPPGLSGSLRAGSLFSIVFSRGLFILQNVFKEPVLRLNEHIMGVFTFELVYFGFDQNGSLPLLGGVCSPGVSTHSLVGPPVGVQRPGPPH